MALVFINQSQSTPANNATTHSWTHTTTTGDTILIVAGFARDDSATDAVINGITHNGKDLVKAVGGTFNVDAKASIWYRRSEERRVGKEC